MWCDMSSITQYVVSIIGVVFFGVLIDVILPDGEMNKFIKGMFAMIAMFVIVSPISKILKADISVDDLKNTANQIQIDNDYIEATTKQYLKSLENMLKVRLVDAGYDGVDVAIDGYLSNNVLTIEKVNINIFDVVFNSEKEHINKYAEITKIAVQTLNVEESDVIIDG